MVQRTIWEFPAGQVDDKNTTEEAIRATALAGTGRGNGMVARGGLEPLGYFFTSPGFTDECCHLFLAKDVVPTGGGFAAMTNTRRSWKCEHFRGRNWSEWLRKVKLSTPIR